MNSFCHITPPCFTNMESPAQPWMSFKVIYTSVSLYVSPLKCERKYQILTSCSLRNIQGHTGTYWCLTVYLNISNFVLHRTLWHTGAYRCILVHTPRDIFVNSRQFHSVTFDIMCYCRALLMPHCLRNYVPRKKFVYFNPLITISYHLEGILMHTCAYLCILVHTGAYVCIPV